MTLRHMQYPGRPIVPFDNRTQNFEVSSDLVRPAHCFHGQLEQKSIASIFAPIARENSELASLNSA